MYSYCNKAKDLFNSLKVPFNYVDLDTMENGTAIQSDLTELTGQKTVPNIFIKGKHIGGCDKVHQLNSEGKLLEMI